MIKANERVTLIHGCFCLNASPLAGLVETGVGGFETLNIDYAAFEAAALLSFTC